MTLEEALGEIRSVEAYLGYYDAFERSLKAAAYLLTEGPEDLWTRALEAVWASLNFGRVAWGKSPLPPCTSIGSRWIQYPHFHCDPPEQYFWDVQTLHLLLGLTKWAPRTKLLLGPTGIVFLDTRRRYREPPSTFQGLACQDGFEGGSVDYVALHECTPRVYFTKGFISFLLTSSTWDRQTRNALLQSGHTTEASS